MNKKQTIKYPIYLDNHATTKVDPRVAQKILYFMTEQYGNSSSIEHIYGNKAEDAIKEAKQHIASLVGCRSDEIIFTSGATESINLAIQGHVLSNLKKSKKVKIALSPLEHKAVIETCESLAQNYKITLKYLKVDKFGQTDLEDLERICKKGISLICIMSANNEIGTIYPVEKIGKIASKYNVAYICDGSQSIGKVEMNFSDWGITYLTISAHKMYGPKGCGALIIKKGIQIEPIIFGGGHQKGIRPGTLNVPGIVGLGETCRLRHIEMAKDEKAIREKRDLLENILKSKFTDIIINGDIKNRLAGNLNISIPCIPNDVLIARVNKKLAISTGSACSSSIIQPSHVLRAIGLSDEIINSSIRIGVGKFNTKAEMVDAANILSSEILKIKSFFTHNF